MTTYDVKGIVAVVTGAASGLGAVTAEIFLKNGAKHVSILDVSEEQGKATAARFSTEYGAESCEFVKCDVTEEEQLLAILECVQKTQGRLDLVINNAGIMNDAAYKKMIKINYTAVVTSTLKSLELLRADRGGPGGTIINVASEVAIKYSPIMPVYNGTKAAVLHFSHSIGDPMHSERTKVRVMAMCPGITATGLFDDWRSKTIFREETEARSGKDKPIAKQKPELVAAGILEMFMQGRSGSAWLVTEGCPPKDITEKTKERFFLGAY